MTLTIQFAPDIEAGLLAQARAEGLEVSDYVQNLVRGQVLAKPLLIFPGRRMSFLSNSGVRIFRLGQKAMPAPHGR